MVATHGEGYGETAVDKAKKNQRVVLQPWGRVEGSLWLNGRPGPNETIILTRGGSPELAFLQAAKSQRRVSTDLEGRYEFNRVAPGSYTLAHYQNQTGKERQRIVIVVDAGQTTQASLGVSGRRLRARIRLSRRLNSIFWTKYQHSLVSKRPPLPKTKPTNVEYSSSSSWNPFVIRGGESVPNQRSFAVEFAQDGSFVVENVPPGSYLLNIHIPGFPSRTFSHEVIVPEKMEGTGTEPLDLGVIHIPRFEKE